MKREPSRTITHVGTHEKSIPVNMEINLNKPEDFECKMISKAHDMSLSDDKIIRVSGIALKELTPAYCNLIKQVNSKKMTVEDSLNAMACVTAQLIAITLVCLDIDNTGQDVAIESISNSFSGTLMANVKQMPASEAMAATNRTLN